MTRAAARGSVLLVVLLASRAAGAAVGTLNADIDGDGKADRVELLANGSVVITDGAGRVEVKAAPSANKARILFAKLATGPRLVLDIVNAKNQREGVVLDRKGGWHVVTRFALGGVGLDREYGIEVEASAAGVYRFQSREGVKRCDGAPAYLFGERLEGATFKKLDRLPINIPANATALTARLDTAAAPVPIVFQAKAGSHQAGATDAGGLAIPRELDDGRNETQWREDLPSGGEGHFFTFRPRVDNQRAQLLRIVPGDPTSAARMKASGRPRAMAVVTKQGAWRFELPDGRGEQLGAAYVVELPVAASDCVSVVIESAWGRGPTTIAELELFAEGERTGGGEALLARIVAEGKSDVTAATAALARRGAAGAAAIDAELAKTTDAAMRRRLTKVLVKIVDPAATASLLRAASEGWVRDQDLIDLIGALAANGQIAALREIAAKGGVALPARIAAAHKLVPTGAGFTALVELAGKGPRDLRHEVIDRLALAPTDKLADAAGNQASAAAAGDLWRAATKSLKMRPTIRASAVAAMLSALPGAADYERRYRLIDGIAMYGDAAALAALDAVLRALPADSKGAALRQVAIRGIASAPRIEATGIVIAFATDKDPGVRLAALGALATTETDAGGPWHAPGGADAIDRVIINAMGDGWPDVRRRAATALGARCQRPGPAKILFEAVSRDKDLDVRGDSLLALVTCNATGVAELLPFIWDSGKHPLLLRERAIGLVVPLGNQQLVQRLIEQLPRWRGMAIESREAISLARAAMATIGLMKPPNAAPALIAALDDVAFPELVADAVLALGELGPQCPAAAKTKLGVLARSDDGQISVAAKRAFKRCSGK